MAEPQLKTENSRPSSSAKFDFETVCAGVLFLIKNSDHIDRLKKYLDADYFFAEDKSVEARALRRLIKTLHEMRVVYADMKITPAFFHTSLQQLRDSDDAEAARRLFDHMMTSPKITEKSMDRGCQHVFLDFLRVIEIVKWADKFMPQYKSGHIADAVKSMKDLTRTIDAISYHDIAEAVDMGKLTMTEIGELLSRSAEANGEVFTIGQPELDDAVGGFERRALHVFIAATNGGKSMMTHHLISRCIEQKLTCHVTVVEDRPKSFLRRLMSNLTGIEQNRIKHNWKDLTPAEIASIKQAKETITKYVKVDFGYGESLETIHQKKIEYDAERIANALEPYDVDIIDYTGHIADKAPGEKTYEKFRNAFAERKNFGLINNKICFDFAQVNREGFKKKQNDLMLTHGELAGSYDLSQVCDNIISINRTPKDIENHTATLLLTKAKDGRLDGRGYEVGTDFARARWIMDGKQVAAEVTIRVPEDRPL